MNMYIHAKTKQNISTIITEFTYSEIMHNFHTKTNHKRKILDANTMLQRSLETLVSSADTYMNVVVMQFH